MIVKKWWQNLRDVIIDWFLWKMEHSKMNPRPAAWQREGIEE